MNETKFTPGPWKWHTDDYFEGLYGSNDYPDYVVFSSLDYGSFSFNENKHRKANKALIAAAPELYEALEKIVQDVQQTSTGGITGPGYWEALDEARAALARARGEL